VPVRSIPIQRAWHTDMTNVWTAAQFVEDRDGAVSSIVEYFAANPRTGMPAHTDARFETLGRQGHVDPEPDPMTPADLLSVDLLSVQVPGPAAMWMLGEGAERIRDLLPIPTGLVLWDAEDEDIGRASPAWWLWDLLRQHDAGLLGTGPVTTSKLLARKRPLLVPIADSVVEGALRPGVDGFWASMRTAMRDTRLREALHAAHMHACKQAPHIPGNLPLLRELDIIVWMRVRRTRNTRRGPSERAAV
jgi:hypothetical protein